MGKREPEFYDKKDLKAREWTETGIKKILGPADSEKQNPYFLGGPKQKLFLKERVHRIEASEDFKTWSAGSKRRKKAANKGRNTKEKNLTARVARLSFNIPVLPIGEILEKACYYYDCHLRFEVNEFIFTIHNTRQANPRSSAVFFLERLARKYLQHCLTDYDEQVKKLHGKVGGDLGVLIMRDKIDQEINRVYPNLLEQISSYQTYLRGDDNTGLNLLHIEEEHCMN